MEDLIKNIEIEVSINHDINEANFILAPQSAKDMNEIYAAHLEEKIGKQIKAYKEDVECALDIVRNSEKTIEEFKETIKENKNTTEETSAKMEEVAGRLSSYANTDLSNLSEAGEAHFDDKFNERANLDLSNLSEAGEARFNEKVNTDLSNLSDTGKGVFNYYVGFPDLGAAVSKSWNTNYTAEENGWVRASGYGVSGNSIKLYINGVGAHGYSWNDANGATYLWFPVLKGQTYKATGAYNSQSLMFYPFKKGV